MNYQKNYDMLISTRYTLKRSKKDGIFESHHIIPKCLGGTDEIENLVLLTPREHFIAHMLLHKIYADNTGLRHAILTFKQEGKYFNSRLYESVRNEHILYMKTNNPSKYLSEESKLSKSEKLKRYIKTDIHRKKISEAAKGKQRRLGAILSDNTKNKIKNSVKEYYANNEVSPETREKLREAMTSKKHSSETIEKCKLSALNRKKYTCHHCNKLFDGGNFKQHMHKKHGYNNEEIIKMKEKDLIKPEGWTAPNHDDNTGIL